MTDTQAFVLTLYGGFGAAILMIFFGAAMQWTINRMLASGLTIMAVAWLLFYARALS